MAPILFLAFGMMAVTSVQIDAVYYYYLRSRASYPWDTSVESLFNNRSRKIWRALITLGGLVLLYLAGWSSLDTTPAQFPVFAPVIAAFLLWIVLLRIAMQVFLTSRGPIRATALALACIIPLGLIVLCCVIAFLFPVLHSVFNNQ